MVEDIRKEITAVINYFDKPLVFKNLNAGMRLRLITRAFPGAKLIFIRRDPRFVIRSILKGRKRVKAQDGKIWGIMPPNYNEITKLPETEMCCAQIFYIEKQILKDLSLLPIQNIKTVYYQDLSISLIDNVAKWIGLVKRKEGIIPKFNKDEVGINNEMIKIESIVKKYPFDKGLFI